MKNAVLRVIVTICAVAALILHQTLKFDTIALGLIFIALIPWISTFLQSAELPGGWKLQFDQVKQEQTKQAEEIARIAFLLEGFLTEDELKHLKALAGDQPFRVRFDETSKFFESELRRLRALGLIANPPGKGIRSLLVNDGQTRDAREFFSITEKGKEYLKLRGVRDV